MKNIKIIFSYDGTRYLGWQKTPHGPNIETELEAALAQILRHPVQLQVASRTDSGVHAEGQVANFFTDSSVSLTQLCKSLNAVLPKDIVIVHLEEAVTVFHPTLDSRGKEYHYFLSVGAVQLPFHRRFAWHVPYPLDLELMRQAALLLKGRHDFSALTNERKENNAREIFEIEILPLSASQWRIGVTGNNFLYKMVRNIVGTLVYVGCGKLSVEEIPLILASRDRKLAGITAPAHGLALKKVYYE